MSDLKTALEVIARCLVYLLIVLSVDFILIFLFEGGPNHITSSLSFVALLEGGIGLTVGGAAASYSPIAAKISETIFHSKPWNATRQKEVEAQAKEWILTGVFLICAALLLSAV
jgi:hypothetical protein